MLNCILVNANKYTQKDPNCMNMEIFTLEVKQFCESCDIA